MKKAAIWILPLLAGIYVGYSLYPFIKGSVNIAGTDKIDYIFNAIVRDYVEEKDPDKIREAAAKGMLESLDAHSMYISKEDMKRVHEDFQGSFEGVGIEFDVISDTITVIHPIPGGASYELGIKSGDKIVKIDGKNVIGIPRAKVPKLLKGPKGTKVAVHIHRNGSQGLIKYEIIRAKIPINSVEAAFLASGSDVGVLVLNRFSATTYREIVDSLSVMKAKGMRKLLIDLRDNPGGLLSESYFVADEFIKEGDTIVYTMGRRKEFLEYYLAETGGLFEDIPLIVMINRASASASEILAGAVQDLDRGLVVGATSFGKGLVQRQYEISDGSAFRLTISKYYTPSGRSIQRPYKNKTQYRSLVGRLERYEGDNITHSIEKLRKEVKNEGKEMVVTPSYVLIKSEENGEKRVDSLPIFKTKSGRTVLGGGGVVPDYVIKSDTITDMSVKLRSERLFFDFADKYLSSEGGFIEPKYRDNFDAFLEYFIVDSKLIGLFKKFAEDHGVEWSVQDYKIDEDFIKTSIKASIASSIWSRAKYIQTFYQCDRQYLVALTLFDKAVEIQNMRK